MSAGAGDRSGTRTLALLPLLLAAGGATVYLLFAVLAYLRYPGAFSPWNNNWLSDLGNRNLNPDGADLYVWGCIATGVLLGGFFAALLPWRSTGSAIQNWLLLVLQAAGAVAALALVMSAVYTEDQFAAHQSWSRVISGGFAVAMFVAPFALHRRGRSSVALTAVAATGYGAIVAQFLFDGAHWIEWPAIALVMVFVCTVGWMTSALKPGRLPSAAKSAVATALLLVLSAAACGGAPLGRQPTLKLNACTVHAVSARCGQLSVAENPAAPDGRSISLNVVVIPARSQDRAPDPLFYLAGGPGGAATDSTAWASSHFQLLNQRRDIVLIDQRGTGGSNPASCTLAPTDPSETAVAAAIQDCVTSVASRADPRFYTTPISVDDFDQVRAALGYDKINLYGGSYGVSSGLSYVQRHGDHVRTALFESGSLLDVRLWERVPVSAQSSLDQVFARCAADGECARAFPNFKAEFASLAAALARTPLTTQIVEPASGGFVKLDLAGFLGIVIDGYLGDVRTAAALPRDVHAAAGGDWTAFLQKFNDAVGAQGSTPMMYISIVCSDEWAALDPKTITAIGAGSVFTQKALAQAATFNVGCKYWPHAAGASGAVHSNAPIVFLNGTADPADPPANVAAAATTMPNSLVVPVPGFGHGVFNQDSSSCLVDKATTFIEIGRPSTPASWSCPNLLPAFLLQ